jgi:glucose-1-phosphate cytidylyltransferase
MKAIILAGGFGSRLQEETVIRPKPMVEIGGKPILWHIMNIYSANGVNEFILALGYKAEFIKEYFLNFEAFNNDISVDFANGKIMVHNENHQSKWKVHLVDTGFYTQTGGRLKRVANWLEDDDTFMFTYGDGVADIDIRALLQFHHSHGKLATVTSVHSPSPFGRIVFEENRVAEFHEKPEKADGWINGGFFVLNRRVIDYIDGDETVWEKETVETLARKGLMMGYRHHGFWSCMDTMRERNFLEDLWRSGKAPWKIWSTIGVYLDILILGLSG